MSRKPRDPMSGTSVSPGPWVVATDLGDVEVRDANGLVIATFHEDDAHGGRAQALRDAGWVVYTANEASKRLDDIRPRKKGPPA